MAEQHDDSFSKARMESLTDGIFATVMTVLGLSLVVPIVTGPAISGRLVSYIWSIFPTIIVYVFSFAVLLVMWIGHNNLFRYYHNMNPRMLWLNGFFLLLIGLTPLSAAFLGRYPLELTSIFVYAINFFLLSLVFRVFIIYIIGHHDQSVDVIKQAKRNNLVPLSLYLLAMPLSLITPYLGLLCFALMPLFYLEQAFWGMYRPSSKEMVNAD